MKRLPIIIIFVFIFFNFTYSQSYSNLNLSEKGSNWSLASDLPSSRVVDWSIAGLDTTTVTCPVAIYNVLETTPALNGNGQIDNSTNFQLLLSNTTDYPTPCVFYFPSGTYIFNKMIDMVGGRIIRGVSSDSTRFISNSKTDLFQILKYDYGTFVDVIDGYEKESTIIHVSDASSFEVGKHIQIKQKNIPELFPDDWAKSWSEDAIGMFARIIEISGNSITLDRPLRINFDNDGGNGYIKARNIGLIENVGFENFYIKANNPQMDGSSFFFKNAANSWLCGIESEFTKYHQVTIHQSCNIEVRNSYFHKSYSYDGGKGYGVALSGHAGNCLIENNVFDSLRHSMLSHLGSSGNVFAYNYSINPLWKEANGDPNDIPPDISLHGHYAYMELFEGNIVQEITSSDWWGPVGMGITFFRNRVEQSDLKLKFDSHNQNLIGNELTGGSTTINIQNGINGTITHGNNENGNIVYNPNYNTELGKSYYLINKPLFFGNNEWPSIGPEFQLDSGTIPAKIRFYQNKPVQKCNCGTPNLSPIITTQPKNQLDICSGTKVTFSIEGLNIDNYQWQIFVNVASEWFNFQDGSNISGSDSSVLTVIVNSEYNNLKLRCKVSNSINEIVSDSVNIVLEKEAPVFGSTLPDQVLYADGYCEAALLDYTINMSASDNCDTNVIITQEPEIGTIVSGASNTVRLIATDIIGNSSEISFNVEVLDTILPQIECIDNKIINLGQGESNYTVNGTEFDPSMVDNCNIAQIENDFNNLASLNNAEFPIDTTMVIWTVKDYSENSASCIFSVIVNGYVGINQVRKERIIIFPNPVKSNIQIKSIDSNIQKITINQISGVEVLTKDNLKKGRKLDVSFLTPGLYILTVQLDSEVFAYRFVKE